MQNSTYKSLIAWLLIASPIWLTSGCSCTRKFEKPENVPQPEIHVVTKGNNYYSFIECTINKAVTIKGRAYWKNRPCSVWSFSTAELEFLEGTTSLPADGIKSVSIEELSPVLTFLTGGLASLVTFFLI